MLTLALWLAPLVACGGFFRNLGFALVAVLLNLMTSGWIVWRAFEWLNHAAPLEGPNGEGSPAAVMLAAFFSGLLWLVPWGLALGSGWASLIPQATGRHSGADND